MSKALITGSFDPITNGHLDIIKRASAIFDTVVVAVVVNPQKKSLFTKEERAELIESVTADLSNVKVDAFSGLLADYVNENGFDVVVRGLRSVKDYEYELIMDRMNSRLFTNNTQTVYFMTAPEYSHVSSSLTKEIVSLGGDAEGMVPDIVLKRMQEKYKDR